MQCQKQILTLQSVNIFVNYNNQNKRNFLNYEKSDID